MIPVGTSFLGSDVDSDGVVNELDLAGDKTGARDDELDICKRKEDLRDDTGNGIFLVKVKGFDPVAI